MARPLRHGCLFFVLALAACDLGAHVTADGGGNQTQSGPSDGCSGACHGAGDSIAPPRDTQGHSNLTAIGVGAHQAHMSASTWHKRFDCATCHIVPQNVGDPGHILVLGANGQMVRDPLPAELTFTGLGMGASWDHATATCTNSYCHGDTLHQVDPATNMISTAGAGGTVTQPVWTLVDGSQSKCGSCHGLPPPAPHPNNSDCGLCHQSMNPGDFDAGKISYPELHIDGKVEVSSTQPCDSCHGGGGIYSPPKDAHGNTATTARGVGAHAQHMIGNPTWHAAIDCNECHLVPGSTTDQTHLDGINEVFMDPTISIPGAPTGTGGKLQVAGAAYDGNTLTCTNTFCHGGGLSPLLGGSAQKPLWTKVDGTQDTCGSCHGAPPPAPHPQSPNIHDCGTCHPTMPTGQNVVATSTKTSITISLPAQHVDGTVQVLNDQPCNNCHGDKMGTPVKGDAPVNAPPTDTTGGTATTLRGVGAHQPHMGTSTWRAPISCGACHKVPAQLESIGHIDTPLPAEVIFGTIAGTTAAWNGSTCANVYCHGATLRNTDGSLAGGTATKPVWTLVDGSQSQCGSCHGLPPPPPHPVDSDCGKCHSPTMTAGQPGVITNPATHIDGAINVNTDQPCNSCHGSAGTPTMNGAPINAPPKDTAGNTATNTRGVGAHQTHMAPASPIGKLVTCADCHMVPGAVNSVGHIDTPLPAEVIFSSRAGTSPTWNGAQCSNVYCHGATLTSGTGGAGGTATSPIWSKVDGSQIQCTSCHGNPPPLPHVQNPACQTCHMDMSSPTTFSDVTKHIDGNLDVNSSQACNSCHGDHGTATTANGDPRNGPPFDSAGTGNVTTLRGVGAHQKHLVPGPTAWRAAITCDECHLVPASVNSVGHIDTPLPAEVIFSGIGAGSTWDGSSCSSYCHGTTLANAGGAVPNPLWTKVDGTQSQCNSCHGDPPTNSPHTAGNTNCGPTCHPDATGNTINPAMAAMHINGTVDVAAGAQHPAGYNMVTMHGYDVDKTGFSTCATASCHGTTLTGGNTGGPSCATVTGCHDKVGTGYTWQTQCTFCHGDIMTASGNGAPPQGVLGGTAATDPTVGAHQKHVAATATHAAWDCTMCHTKPTNALTPGHIDGTGGIVQAELHFSTLNPASTYSFTAYTCANNYCHGTGRANGTSPAWTSTTALSCVGGCHGGATSYTGMSGHHSNPSEHRKACNYCHGSVVDTTPNITNPALHVNGVKEVVLPGGGTYSSSTKRCSGVPGCHNGASDTW